MTNYSTQQALQHLRLAGMAAELSRQQENRKLQEATFDQRFSLLLDAEINLKCNKRISALLKRAKLRYAQAVMEDIEYRSARKIDARQISMLGSCDWIRNRHNVIITGATGTGKTWLACALANQACRNGLSVAYMTATNLFENLRLSYADGSLMKFKRSLTSVQMLLIDDLGIGGISNELSPILLEILDQQSMVGSLMITSQYRYEKWYELFGDPTIADAILDRVIHGSYQIKLEGESMRKLRARS